MIRKYIIANIPKGKMLAYLCVYEYKIVVELANR